MLAHAGHDDGLAVGRGAELAHYLLGNHAVAPAVAERMLRAERLNLRNPLRAGDAFDLFGKRVHYPLRVAHDRHGDADILADFRRVDVDVDDPGVRREGAEAAVTRSSNRMPTPMMRSARSIAQLLWACPCMPGIPRLSTWSPANAPMPRSVVMTGICAFSATSRTSASARAMSAPCPTSNSGRRDS